jgi:pseudouridine-5'-phosphate glycosidase
MDVAAEVAAALREGAPVVALETALVTHGLPNPLGAETALALEAAVRAAGAIPATIGLVGGRVRVGLTEQEVRNLGASGAARKASLRDLPVLVARGHDGGTTVAATVHLAHRAGIGVMSTGGIGGVHRGHPFDVSADLAELARTPITVTCAGAKAILDLPLTMEWLETAGVTVVGYGTDELPAFYSRSSGLPVDARADTPAEVAAIVRARRAVDIPGAVVVGVPVPAEHEIPAAEVEQAIAEALEAAGRAGIRGHAVTPFLLERVAESTGGRARRANTALLERSARVGGEVAVALAAG